MIAGEYIHLRDVDRSDVPLILKWENDPNNWEVSERSQAYTLDEIKALIASSENYMETKQKRWMIVANESNTPIGTVDVFQGDLSESETGIGILIAEENNRRKGFAKEAIALAIIECVSKLNIQKVFALVHSTNEASIRLFEKCGFESVSSQEENSNFDQPSKPTIKFSICLKK